MADLAEDQVSSTISDIITIASGMDTFAPESPQLQQLEAYIKTTIPTPAVLLNDQDLIEKLKDGTSEEIIHGENHIKDYLGKTLLPFYATKTAVLIDALMKRNIKEASIRGLEIKKEIEKAWPYSFALCKRRIYILHFALRGNLTGPISNRSKTLEIKNGPFQALLQLKARCKSGTIEVLVECKGLSPPITRKIMSQLELFLQGIGFNLYDYKTFKLLWMKAIGGQEFNDGHFNRETFRYCNSDAVSCSYQAVISTEEKSPINLYHFQEYLSTTILQFQSYINQGEDYKATMGKYAEVRSFPQVLDEDFFQKTCICSKVPHVCKGAKDFLYYEPCSNNEREYVL